MTEPSGPEFSSAPQASRACAIVVAALGFSATGVLIGGLWAAPLSHRSMWWWRSLARVSGCTTTWLSELTTSSARLA